MIDFLKVRYNSPAVAILSAIAIIIFLFSAMTAQWVGGGRLIESLTGLQYTTSLFIFAISVLVYVVIGGFRAVAVTDAVQGAIMVIGTLILLIGVIIAGGGVPAIMQDLLNENPRLVTPFGADGSLTAAYVSSFWILVGVGVVALPQMAVRAMSYKNSRSMHRALVIGTIVTGFIMLNMHLIGIFARPVLPGIEVGDKVIPLLALEVLPPWLAGIVLAAPMAAIMSTVDSLLLLVSSAVVKDVYLNFIKPDAKEKTVKWMSFGVTGNSRNHRIPTRLAATRTINLPESILIRRTRSRLHLASRHGPLLEIRQQIRRNRIDDHGNGFLHSAPFLQRSIRKLTRRPHRHIPDRLLIRRVYCL